MCLAQKFSVALRAVNDSPELKADLFDYYIEKGFIREAIDSKHGSKMVLFNDRSILIVDTTSEGIDLLVIRPDEARKFALSLLDQAPAHAKKQLIGPLVDILEKKGAPKKDIDLIKQMAGI